MNDDEANRAREMYREVTTLEPLAVDDAYPEVTLDAVFGKVWTRPGLTRKERRWITLSVAAMTGSEAAIVSHLRAALVSGDISREEMMEWVVHFAHYAGWPLSANAYVTFRKITAELDAAGD